MIGINENNNYLLNNSNYGFSINDKYYPNVDSYLLENNDIYEGILNKFIQNKDILLKFIETRNNKFNISYSNILERVRNVLKEQVLNDIINNSKKEDIVYIIGHKNPDTDSIFSSIVLSHVLKSLGINAVPSKLDNDYEFTNSSKILISDYLEEKLVSYDNESKVILVDHNNLDGIDKDKVIGAIDHHIITYEVIDMIEIEYASTGLLIYDLFKDKYNFNDKDKMLVALTVLSDTDFLCSSRYTLEDKKLFEELDFKEDINCFQKKYFVTTDFNESISYNLKYDYKEYNRNNINIKRSMILSYTKEFNDNINDYLESIKDIDNYLLIWLDYEEKNTHIYLNNNYIKLDYILGSTNLVLKLLDERNILNTKISYKNQKV